MEMSGRSIEFKQQIQPTQFMGNNIELDVNNDTKIEIKNKDMLKSHKHCLKKVLTVWQIILNKTKITPIFKTKDNCWPGPLGEHGVWVLADDHQASGG